MDRNNYIFDAIFYDNDIVDAGEEHQPMEGDVVLEFEAMEEDARLDVILEMMYGDNGEEWIFNGDLREQLARSVADQLADIMIDDGSDSEDAVVFAPRTAINDLIVFDDNQDEDGDDDFLFYDGPQ